MWTLAWEVHYQPWFEKPYGVYLMGGTSIVGELIERFQTESEACMYCQHRLAARCVAIYPIETEIKK